MVTARKCFTARRRNHVQHSDRGPPGTRIVPPYTVVKWRKCMGIEPTSRLLDRRPSGFEDRAGHQPWTHFRSLTAHYIMRTAN